MASKKLRILIMANMIYPDFLGGAAKVAFEQAKFLKEMGHEVTVVTLKKHRYYESQESIDGVIYYRYDNVANRKIFGRSITTRLSGKNFLNDLHKLGLRFDTTILHYPHDGATYFKSKYKNVPALYVFHAPSKKELTLEGLDREKTNFWARFLKNKFIKWTDRCENKAVFKASRIAVMSHFMKTELLTTHEGLDKNKVIILSSGIDMEHFKPVSEERRLELRKELKFQEGNLVFITVRRLVKRMGIDNLIKASEFLHEKYPFMKIKIIGDGLLRQELQNEIKKLGLEKCVELTGRLSKEKLLKYYQAADCFILPTIALEGLGIVSLEALACGLPVLGTPAGATPEILENINPALLFRSTRYEHIATGMDWFIRKHKELNLRGVCREYVEQNHQWKDIVKNLNFLLQDMAE